MNRGSICLTCHRYGVPFMYEYEKVLPCQEHTCREYHAGCRTRKPCRCSVKHVCHTRPSTIIKRRAFAPSGYVAAGVASVALLRRVGPHAHETFNITLKFSNLDSRKLNMKLSKNYYSNFDRPRVEVLLYLTKILKNLEKWWLAILVSFFNIFELGVFFCSSSSLSSSYEPTLTRPILGRPPFLRYAFSLPSSGVFVAS